MITKALNMAAEAHLGQERRGSGHPYIVHPVTVAFLLAKYKTSKHLEELTVACILHDCPEDTKLQLDKIRDEFGPMVYEIVSELTSDPAEIERIGKHEHIKQKCIKISSYSLTCKLCDRLGNIMDGPTDNYLKHTTKLMYYILDNRKVSRTQKRIILDILEITEKK